MERFLSVSTSSMKVTLRSRQRSFIRFRSSGLRAPFMDLITSRAGSVGSKAFPKASMTPQGFFLMGELLKSKEKRKMYSSGLKPNRFRSGASSEVSTAWGITSTGTGEAMVMPRAMKLPPTQISFTRLNRSYHLAGNTGVSHAQMPMVYLFSKNSRPARCQKL